MKICTVAVLCGLENIKSGGYKSPACFDICCMDGVVIPANGFAVINTGIKAAIQEGFYAEIRSKSVLSVEHHIEKGAGVIDSDYRGYWLVKLYNFGSIPVTFNKGDKIAQVALREVIKPKFIPCEHLDETERGELGFGSTGA